jgi:hypothetical protein
LTAIFPILTVEHLACVDRDNQRLLNSIMIEELKPQDKAATLVTQLISPRAFAIENMSIGVYDDLTMSASPTPPLPMSVVSPSLLVSLAATPWLATIVTLRTTAGCLEQIGLISEEMFRGDRLPVLHLSDRIAALVD